MCNKVTLSEIRNRQIALEDSSNEKNSYYQVEYHHSDPDDCKRKFELANRTKQFCDVRAFIYEVSQLKVPDEFIEECFDVIRENNNPELYTVFKKKILSKLDNYTLESCLNRDDINKTISSDIKWRLTANKVVDRILENDKHIQEVYPLNEFFKKNQNNGYMFLIEKCCNIISNNFKLPVNAVANIAIEECSYLLQKNSIDYDEKEMVKYIISHCINLENDKSDYENRLKLQRVIETNYCIDNDIKVEPKALERTSEILSTSYNIMQMPYKVGYKMMEDIAINAPAWDICKNISYFFSYVENILVSDKSGEAAGGCLVAMDDFFNKLYEARIEDPEARDIFIAYKKACELQIAKNNKFITNFDNIVIKERFLSYSKSLRSLRENIEEALSYIYPKYAIECMKMNEFVNESDNSISMDAFINNQYISIINKCRRINQILEHRINLHKSVNDNIRKVLEISYDKLSPYDILEQNGSVDFCLEQYKIINKDYSQDLHDFFTEACKKINQGMLNSAVDNCYYTMSEDTINFYIKESRFIVSLSDKDKEQIAVSEANIELNDLVENIALINMIDENFNLMESAEELFIENPDRDIFNTFLEGCRISGIDREELVELCNAIQVKNSEKDHIAFGYYAESAIANYIPSPYHNHKVQLEAYALLQALVEDSLVKKTETKSLTSTAQDKAKEKSDNNSVNKEKEINNKKSSNTSKNNTTKGKDLKKENEQVKNNEENGGFKNPFKGLKLNDIKLAMKGLAKTIKDASAKVRSGIKDMDLTVSRLVKAVKSFFVSDRREAIIKGSIIPSFHRCIIIAVGEAALWAVNPVLSIISMIGGFAISKKLTERERSLLLDDIEVELQVVEKELQMAESQNKIKKMRALMKIKKDLQRQYQRIKYNIRIGKDIIPSKVGVPGED